MKGYLMRIFVLVVMGSIYSCHPNLVRNPFPPMPNVDSLNAANKLVGKHYEIVDSFVNADFNYAAIEKFDSIAWATSMDSVRFLFNPVAGNFTVFQFIAESNGIDPENRIRPFHDILIVKTDHTKRIIDAFQYTLEWGEMPCSYDLYRRSKDSLYLENNMELNRLEMLAIREYQNDVELLKDDGIIHLNKRK